MKVWYSKKWDMYAPVGWFDEDGPDDVVELEVAEEVIDCQGGDDDPYCHAGRWELMFEEAHVAHSLMTKIPWKAGKYRIIIEEVI